MYGEDDYNPRAGTGLAFMVMIAFAAMVAACGLCAAVWLLAKGTG